MLHIATVHHPPFTSPTHRNALQHTATHCNTLQHTATHCNTPVYCTQYTDFMLPSHTSHVAYGHLSTHPLHIPQTSQHTATHCNTLQHTATHCNTLQHTAHTPCSHISCCIWAHFIRHLIYFVSSYSFGGIHSKYVKYHWICFVSFHTFRDILNLTNRFVSIFVYVLCNRIRFVRFIRNMFGVILICFVLLDMFRDLSNHTKRFVSLFLHGLCG